MAILGTSGSRSTSPGLVSILFTATADGAGVFHSSGIEGDNLNVASIGTDAAPWSFVVRLASKVQAIAFQEARIVHNSPYTSEATIVSGPQFPQGHGDMKEALIHYGYLDNGVISAIPANLKICFRIDVRTMVGGYR